jgi:acetylornithine deacetylase/succinyl-diaminopimelate desuccinylase-like protein
MRLLLPVLPLAVLAAPALAQNPADKWHAEGRALYEQIVNVPSVEGRGKVGDVVTLLKAKFVAAGIIDITVKPYDATQALIIRWRASGRSAAKPMLLMAHMDVVEARKEDWSFDPFTFQEKDGYFYGRGTSDDKQGVMAVTMSLLRLKAEGFKPKRDIIVLFTGDEETAGNGAKLAASDWLPLVRAEFALNADAGGGGFLKDGTAIGYGLQSAEKFYATYSFTVRNPGGHSSRPRADNAIYELATALKKLEAHRFTPALNETTRAYFAERAKTEKGALGNAMRRWLANPADGAAADVIEADPTEVGQTRTRCVATRLQGGHADNALPAMARATVNCRMVPTDDPKAIQAELQTVVGDGVKVEVTDLFGAPTKASPLRPDVVKAYTDAVRTRFPGIPIVPQMSAGATDGTFFRAAGIPVYGVDAAWLVVPEDERAHGKDERLPVKSFYDNLDIWHDMVAKLAG